MAPYPTLTSFTAGDLVVSISGDGDGSGTYTDNQASPAVLEELTTSGTVVGQLVLPQTTTVINGTTEYALSAEYGSSSEGSLQLSADGQSLVYAGYGINAQTFNAGAAAVYGNAALAQTTSVRGGTYTAVPRVIADIGYDATVDTSTALYDVDDTNNPRSVATVDGTTFYVSGQGVKGDTTQGVVLAHDGASGATPIDTSTDTRTAEIVGGQLYVSRDSTQGTGGTSNIASYGTALPTAPTAATALPGIDGTVTLTAAQGNTVNGGAVGTAVHLSPENFFFADATTLYVADGGTPKEGGLGDGGLQKWSFDGTSWVLDYTLSQGLDLVSNTATSGTTGLIGLTGTVQGGVVQLYATNTTVGDTDQSYLYAITDQLAATTTPGAESFTALMTAAPDTKIRGVAFAPQKAAADPTATVVSSGTTRSGLVITNGSTLTVRAGGTVSATTVLSGGTAVVAGADVGTSLAHGATETLLGTATGDKIDGTLIVSGATAVVTGATVYDGGVVDLYIKGASATGTVLTNGGTLNISNSATATNTTIVDGGTVSLQSPKAMLAGSLTFSGAGTLQVAALSSAGYGDQAVISGFGAGDAVDLLLIGAGATLTTTVVSGNTVATVSTDGPGQSFTFAGSVASSLSLVSDRHGGEEIVFSAPAPTATVVASGSTRSGLVVSSGSALTVQGGGAIVAATVLSGGTATVSGTDTGSVISAGGTELVLGTATGDRVLGTQVVSAATAVVNSETVVGGGSVDLFLKGAVSNALTVSSGGTLNISGNATANDTVVTGGGIIDLQSPKAVLGGTLTFSGAGTLLESAVISAPTASATYGVAATISGFGAGDAIDLAAFGAGASLSSTVSGGNTVETVTSGTVSEAFTFAGIHTAADFALSPDGGTGVMLVADPARPRITADIASPATGDLGAGRSITFTLSSDQTVSVTGTPTLALDDGGTASYVASASTGTSLVFSATVLSGQNTPTLAVSSLDLPNGATIRNATGSDLVPDGAAATFTGLDVDTTAPAITGLTLDKGAYKLGDTVTATIQLASAYDGDGDYALGVGSTVDGAALTAGSYDQATNRLTATFQVTAAAQEVIDGSVPVNVTVADAAGNPCTADTTGIPGATIDTQAPTAVSVAGFADGPTDKGDAPAAAGSTVGALTTTDASPNESFTYALGGADANAFTLDGATLKVGGTALTDGTTYDLTVTSTDRGGNQYAQAVQVTGATTPIVTSIVPAGSSPTDASSDPFTVTFSQAVSGVTASAFALSGTDGTGTVGTPATADGGTTWTVPVTGVSGDGTLGLDLTGTAGIASTSTGTPLGGPHGSTQTYMVDTTAPTASSPTVTAPQNGGPTPIGIAAPSDNLTPAGSLAIAAGTLPTDGTVTLADGTTRVTAGESLTAAQLTGLLFTPTPGVSGQGSTFTYTVTDAAGNTAPGTAALNVGGPGTPTIAGTHAGATSAEASVAPFAGVTVTDPSSAAGATETLTIGLTGGGGLVAEGAGYSGPQTLTGGGSSYQITGAAAAVTAELDALSFTPAAGAPGATTTTTLVLTDTSSTGASVADSGTGVADTAAAAPPPVQSPPPAVAPDAVSFASQAVYQNGAFTLTGTASSPAGVRSVEISAEVDGVATDLGAATVNADGTFTFADRVGPHTQGSITASLTDGAGGTASGTAAYSLVGSRPGAGAVQDTYGADGGVVQSTRFGAGGRRFVDVEAPGQAVDLQPSDIVANHGRAGTSFVFSRGDGLDVIDGFRVGGPGHDTINLPSADFRNLADVLRHTGDVGGSAFITDPKTGDAIRLAGVTAAELKAHPRDFAFVG